MAAYVIYQAEVVDAERYEEYKAQVSPNIAAAGGRYLVRGGAAEALEGDLPAGRTVVLEFPTRQAALDWYWSKDYAVIRKLTRSTLERFSMLWTESTEIARDGGVGAVELTNYEALSFDCYGTLIDWEVGLAAVLNPGRAGTAWILTTRRC